MEHAASFNRLPPLSPKDPEGNLGVLVPCLTDDILGRLMLNSACKGNATVIGVHD